MAFQIAITKLTYTDSKSFCIQITFYTTIINFFSIDNVHIFYNQTTRLELNPKQLVWIYRDLFYFNIILCFIRNRDEVYSIFYWMLKWMIMITNQKHKEHFIKRKTSSIFYFVGKCQFITNKILCWMTKMEK